MCLCKIKRLLQSALYSCHVVGSSTLADCSRNRRKGYTGKKKIWCRPNISTKKSPNGKSWCMKGYSRIHRARRNSSHEKQLKEFCSHWYQQRLVNNSDGVIWSELCVRDRSKPTNKKLFTHLWDTVWGYSIHQLFLQSKRAGSSPASFLTDALSASLKNELIQFTGFTAGVHRREEIRDSNLFHPHAHRSKLLFKLLWLYLVLKSKWFSGHRRGNHTAITFKPDLAEVKLLDWICSDISDPALLSCVGATKTQKMLMSEVSSAPASFRRRWSNWLGCWNQTAGTGCT